MIKRISCATLAILFSAALPQAVRATTSQQLLSALKQEYTLTRFNNWSNRIEVPGTVFVVQQDGLYAQGPDAFPKAIRIEGGKIVAASRVARVAGFFGSGGYQVKRGDKVYLSNFYPTREGFEINAWTLAKHRVVHDGQSRVERGRATVEFRFPGGLRAVTTEAALTALSNWFKTEEETSESHTVKVGQTPEQVEAILGPPKDRIDLGSKKIFVYKDFKVTFLNGHVSDVQ